MATSGATEGKDEHLVGVVGPCPMPAILDGGRGGFHEHPGRLPFNR